MHGSSGLGGLKRNGLKGVRCRCFALLVSGGSAFLFISIRRFWIGAEKRFDRNRDCCKMHRLNRTEWMSLLFNKMNRNNLCGYVWRHISVRNSRYRNHVNLAYKWRSVIESRLATHLIEWQNILNWRVWSWLRLNAGGMLNTCKSNDDEVLAPLISGGRVSNA